MSSVKSTGLTRGLRRILPGLGVGEGGGIPGVGVKSTDPGRTTRLPAEGLKSPKALIFVELVENYVARLLGHAFGDGYIHATKYYFIYTNKSKDLTNEVKTPCDDVFPLRHQYASDIR